MFDLEQKISDWRKQMLAAGIKTPVPLEELENHLREEIERQMKLGLNEQKAFEIAIRQIGKANMLKKEFKKIKTRKADRSGNWGEIIVAVFSTLIPLPWLCEMLFKTKLELTSSQQMSILVAGAMLSLLAWSGRVGYEIFPVIHAKQIRFAVACSCFALFVLWLIVFSHTILPRCDFNTSQLFVTRTWGFLTPGGIFIGLLWGLETVARKKERGQIR